MPAMEITETVHAPDRAAWRQWLAENHASKDEIWLITYKRGTGKPNVPYIDAVLEALCFGWVDGIAKTMDEERTAQRFTPRRAKSNWTELNKERARRLIEQGLMTEAGFAKLPDLSLEAFQIAPDIFAALQADPVIWENFQNFPPLYHRIRISHIEEARRQPDEFERRLTKFLQKTRENKQFGGME